MNREIKMIALDLDRTTLNSNKEFSDTTVQILNKAAKKGIFIVASTGRSFHSLPKQLFDIPAFSYAVTSNGAIITELKNSNIIYRNCHSKSVVLELLPLLRTSNLSVETFVNGKAYINAKELSQIKSGEITYRDAPYVIQTRTPVPDIFDFMEENAELLENINLNFKTLECRAMWLEKLSKMTGFKITSSYPYNIELGGTTTSKASALAFLLEQFSLKKEKLMACGDSLNDLEMLSFAGLSVAMENAADELKKHADFITDSNDNDGVAKAISLYCLS